MGSFLSGDNVFATACDASADCPSGTICVSGICTSGSASVYYLTSPQNGATNISIPVYFSWVGAISSGGIYQLFYKKDSDTTFTKVDNLTTNSYSLSGLLSNTKYNWKVGACFGSLCVSTDTWSFTTQETSSTGKTMVVNYPNNGESFNIGSSYDIKWTSSGVSNVNIDLQLGSGIQWWRLASNVPATNGKLTWTVQSSSAIGNISAGNNYKILIWDASSSTLQSSTTQDISDNYFNIVTSGGSSGTTSTGTTTTSGCDSSSFLSSSSPYVFNSTSPKTNMCGKTQFYSVVIPPGQECDLKWSLQSSSDADYDLYTKWTNSSVSRDSFSDRAVATKGATDELYKTKAPNGTYYVLVYSENAPVGNYSLTALVNNCSGTTTSTTTNTTTSTTTSQDQTIAQLQSQINQLLNQLSQVRAQLQSMQSGQTNTNNTNTNTTTNTNNAWCYTFRNNLKYLDSGPDVLALQTVLQKEGLYYGKIGGNFGALTKNAVIKFQQKYLVPLGLALGTGFVGPQTLNKLNDIYDCE